MSVAFTKEDSAETAAETVLPPRPVSTHPNLVTAEGLRAIERDLQLAREAYEAANSIDDVNERRRATAGPLRDVTYWAERLRTAEVVAPHPNAETVSFGSTVRFSRDDGRIQTYRIVGEDEADPSAGSISYVSPIATVLMGKGVGDIATIGNQEIEIVSIS